MKNASDALSEISKIGNYAVPIFGFALTSLFCANSFNQFAHDGQSIVINFALYTLAASFVAYAHRISYLRSRAAQRERGETETNLPLWAVFIFMLAHLVLISVLGSRLWSLGAIGAEPPIEIKFVDYLSKMAVPVIGFLGVYIAWRQWSTAAYRFRLDLFEKRFVVYESIIDFILSIRGGGNVTDNQMAIFKEKTLSSRFIFDNKVAEYISEIKEKAYDVQTYSAESDGMPAGEERVAILRKASDARKWLYKQIEEETLNKKFGSYLEVTPSRLGIIK